MRDKIFRAFVYVRKVALTAKISVFTVHANVHTFSKRPPHLSPLFIIVNFSRFVQITISIEMRDRGSSAPGYSVIDTFTFVVHTTQNSSDPVLLVGEAGLATISLGYRLRCANLSACGEKPSTTCATLCELLT